jgi:hypothetical protein
MSEQAERDAVRAAQDEARAKQLLDEVTTVLVATAANLSFGPIRQKLLFL